MPIWRPRTRRRWRGGEADQALPLEHRAAGDSAGRAWQQTEQGKAGHGLAAPALTNDAKPFPGLHVEAHAAGRLNLSVTSAEEHAQATDAEQRIGGGCGRGDGGCAAQRRQALPAARMAGPHKVPP
jgi:hypothetical protein